MYDGDESKPDSVERRLSTRLIVTLTVFVMDNETMAITIDT